MSSPDPEVKEIQRRLEAADTIERGLRVTMTEFLENRAGSADRGHALRLRLERAAAGRPPLTRRPARRGSR